MPPAGTNWSATGSHLKSSWSLKSAVMPTTSSLISYNQNLHHLLLLNNMSFAKVWPRPKLVGKGCLKKRTATTHATCGTMPITALEILLDPGAHRSCPTILIPKLIKYNNIIFIYSDIYTFKLKDAPNTSHGYFEWTVSTNNKWLQLH